MTEELMVGTVGWDHDDWIGGYYPDDMPDDWRFGYYSNDFRAVLVPGDHFADEQLSAVEDWLEDCDDSFRFVVEIPSCLLPQSERDRLNGFLDRLAGLSGRAAGYYIDLSTVDSDRVRFVELVECVADRGPLCVNLPLSATSSAGLDEVLSRLDIGRCWLPNTMPAPLPGGGLMLALTDTQDPKEQRRIVEALEGWMKQSGGVAGVFYYGGVGATQAASQTRIIAEMLGI
jgi:hypothetical protein